MEETGRRLLPSPLLPSTLAALALVLSGAEAQRERWLRPLVAGEARLVLRARRRGGLGRRARRRVRRAARRALRDRRAARGRRSRSTPEIVLDRTRRSARRRSRVSRSGRRFLPAPRRGARAAHALGVRRARRRDGRRRRRAARDDRRLRRHARAVRQADRLVPGGEAPARERADRRRGSTLAGVRRGDARSTRGSADAETLARMAKAKACDVYVFAASRAVQLHGGFGFTLDCDAHLYLKRAQTTRPAFGDAMASAAGWPRGCSDKIALAIHSHLVIDWIHESFRGLGGSDPRRDRRRGSAARPRSVKEIVELFPISQPAISKHLRILREAGLVSVEARGPRAPLPARARAAARDRRLARALPRALGRSASTRSRPTWTRRTES